MQRRAHPGEGCLLQFCSFNCMAIYPRFAYWSDMYVYMHSFKFSATRSVWVKSAVAAPDNSATLIPKSANSHDTEPLPSSSDSRYSFP